MLHRVRYLVTGAAGFVGTAVVRRVLGEGDTAVAVVRDAASERARALRDAGAEVVEKTVGDPKGIAAAAKGCEVVVHCAAVASHRAARRALRWTNIAGTENVVNAARHAGCERVVHVSCADVTLSNQDRVHWNEARALERQPLDDHARTKQLAEELALAASTRGVEVTAVRPALLWGPGDETHLPALAREGLAGGIRLVGSGETFIATTYIESLVDAIVEAAEVEAAAGNAYYVTDGDLLEAREFFGQVSEAVGLPRPRTGPGFSLAYALAWARMRVGGDGLWPTDVIHRGRSTHFDCQSAMTDLGWSPRPMAEGMSALAAWVKERGGAQAIAALGRAPAPASYVDAEVAAAGGDAPPG